MWNRTTKTHRTRLVRRGTKVFAARLNAFVGLEQMMTCNERNFVVAGADIRRRVCHVGPLRRVSTRGFVVSDSVDKTLGRSALQYVRECLSLLSEGQ